MIKTEAEEIVEEIEGKQERNNKKREINKNMIDNYTNFIRRLIIKYKIKGGKDSYLLYYLVSQLSLTHHGYYYLCANLYKQKITLSKETIGLLKDTITLYSTFYNAFFKNDLTLAHQVQVNKQRLQDTCYQLLETKKGRENVILCNMSEIIRMSQMASTVIFGFRGEEQVNG